MKLKERLKNWLFKEEFDCIKTLKSELKTMQMEIEGFKEIKETYEECLRKIDQSHKILIDKVNMHHKSHVLLEDCRKFMNSICDIGTDVGFKSNDHSWAVICIHGKVDYVKFIDMNQRDIMAIANFLKNFEYSNRVTDSPLYKKHIEDMIVKW